MSTSRGAAASAAANRSAAAAASPAASRREPLEVGEPRVGGRERARALQWPGRGRGPAGAASRRGAAGGPRRPARGPPRARSAAAPRHGRPPRPRSGRGGSAPPRPSSLRAASASSSRRASSAPALAVERAGGERAHLAVRRVQGLHPGRDRARARRARPRGRRGARPRGSSCSASAPVARELQGPGGIAQEQRHAGLQRDRAQVGVRGLAPVAERVLRVAEQVPRPGAGRVRRGRRAGPRPRRAPRGTGWRGTARPPARAAPRGGPARRRARGPAPRGRGGGRRVGRSTRRGGTARAGCPPGRAAPCAAAPRPRRGRPARTGSRPARAGRPAGRGSEYDQAQVLALDLERPGVHLDAVQPERRASAARRSSARRSRPRPRPGSRPRPRPTHSSSTVTVNRVPWATTREEAGRTGGFGHRGPADQGHLVVVEHEVEPPRAAAAGEQAVVVLVARPAEEQSRGRVPVRGVRLDLRLDDGVAEGPAPGEGLPGEVVGPAHLEAVGAALVAAPRRPGRRSRRRAGPRRVRNRSRCGGARGAPRRRAVGTCGGGGVSGGG